MKNLNAKDLVLIAGGEEEVPMCPDIDQYTN